MRLLRLDLFQDDIGLHLHPLICVVPRLQPSQQQQLVGAVSQLASGSVEGLGGLVQHQGLLVELTDLGSMSLGSMSLGSMSLDSGRTNPSNVGVDVDRAISEVPDVLDRLQVEIVAPALGADPRSPMVLAGRFQGLPEDRLVELLDGLDALAARRQLVVVTESSTVWQWVQRSDPCRVGLAMLARLTSH